MALKKKLLGLAGFFAALFLFTGSFFLLRPVTVFNAMLYARESASGIQSATVTVSGRPMHYLAAGPANGPVVVLVHGLGGRAEDWLELLPHLTRAGYRVYAPDLFGYGRSPKPADFSYSVRDEANAVAGFFDALHIEKADLGGWSMGGWIVQLAAASHPERVRHLIIFDSVGLHEAPSWNTRLFTPTTPQELAQLEALLMPNPPAIPGFVARDILRLSRRNGWVIQRALDSMLTGRDTTDAILPTLKMPVLIVWGSLDRITPLNQAKTMHALVPNSELFVVEDCGHLAPRQCTAKIGPRIVNFLSHSK